MVFITPTLDSIETPALFLFKNWQGLQEYVIVFQPSKFMRKEVLVAILIGALLGGVVAFGIWRANLALVPKRESLQTEQTPQSSTPEDKQTSSLIITQPENNSIVSEGKVTVKGAALPNSTVVILANNDDLIIQTGKDGGFEQEVELEGGPNEITITAYDEAGNETTETLTLVYSTEFTKEQ